MLKHHTFKGFVIWFTAHGTGTVIQTKANCSNKTARQMWLYEGNFFNNNKKGGGGGGGEGQGSFLSWFKFQRGQILFTMISSITKFRTGKNQLIIYFLMQSPFPEQSQHRQQFLLYFFKYQNSWKEKKKELGADALTLLQLKCSATPPHTTSCAMD